VKTIELRCAARGGNHGAEKNQVGTAALDFIEHLLVIEAERPAVEHRNLRRFLFADECGDLRMERVNRQVAIAPRRPISHRRGDK
jgi:hypothetical protein